MQTFTTERNEGKVDMHIPDPHEIILTYFNYGNRNFLTEGSLVDFKKKLLGFMMLFVGLKFLPMFGFSSVLIIGLSAVVFFFIIEGMLLALEKMNKYSMESMPLIKIGIVVAGMVVVMVLISWIF